MDCTKHFWVTLLESLRVCSKLYQFLLHCLRFFTQDLDAEALLYVNIERPIAVAPSNCMELQSDKLLGQVGANETSVAYHIPGEQHAWEFNGHMANPIFQKQLEHVMDQTHEVLLVGVEYRASQKAAKQERKKAATEQAVVALAQKMAKKLGNMFVGI